MIQYWHNVVLLCVGGNVASNELPLYSSGTVAVKIKEADSFMASVQLQQMIIPYISGFKCDIKRLRFSK